MTNDRVMNRGLFSRAGLALSQARYRIVTTIAICLLASGAVMAKEGAEANSLPPATDVLTPEDWERLDGSVDQALSWLVSKQQRDGSFPTLPTGQPGVTCLVVLAFASHGHLPGMGPYGSELESAVKYTLSCQKSNGLVALTAPRGASVNRNVSHEIGVSNMYNHAIASLALSELYTMRGEHRAFSMQAAIEKSLEVTLNTQKWPKQRDIDRGGWRYAHKFQDVDSDLTLTGWHLMFLRSAKNAGFTVPQQPIDDAVGYVRRCFMPQYRTFNYIAKNEDRRSRGVTGAGVLALAHAGHHNSEEARFAGDWILKYNFDRYNRIEKFSQRGHYKDRYHYSVFQCSQAMYQLGGHYWEEFYPRTVKTLLNNQQNDGSWPNESHSQERQYGNCYTTSLVLLALGAPNQLLPVFQR